MAVAVMWMCSGQTSGCSMVMLNRPSSGRPVSSAGGRGIERVPLQAGHANHEPAGRSECRLQTSGVAQPWQVVLAQDAECPMHLRELVWRRSPFLTHGQVRPGVGGTRLKGGTSVDL